MDSQHSEQAKELLNRFQELKTAFHKDLKDTIEQVYSNLEAFLEAYTSRIFQQQSSTESSMTANLKAINKLTEQQAIMRESIVSILNDFQTNYSLWETANQCFHVPIIENKLMSFYSI